MITKAIKAITQQTSIAFLLCAISPGHVSAQNIPFVTDSERVPPELAYEGMTYKGFKIQPELKLSTSHNSNIYVTDKDEKSDLIYNIKPSLKISKEYGISSIGFAAIGDIERYKKFSEEKRENYLTTLSYEASPNSRWNYSIKGGYQNQARSREDPTGLGASQSPLYIKTLAGQGKVTRTFNRLSLTLIGTYDKIKNEDGISAADGITPLNLKINDRNQYGGESILLYELLPSADIGSLAEKAVYLKTGFAHHDYTEQSNTALSRDRNKISGLLGFITRMKSISLTADLGVGYLRQDFKEESIKPTNELDVYAKIKYLASPKHILSFDLDRDVTENNTFLDGIVETNFRLASDYELQHNLYLNSNLLYQINEFDSGREDNDLIGNVSLRYLMSPRLESKFSIAHTKRSSTSPTSEFDRTMLLFQLTGKL